MRVRVYWNSTRKLWSIKSDGLVALRLAELCLKDVKFIVKEKGRLRVVRTGRKTPHAFVEGEICEKGIVDFSKADRFRYNPFLVSNFQTETGEDVFCADYVLLSVSDKKPMCLLKKS